MKKLFLWLCILSFSAVFSAEPEPEVRRVPFRLTDFFKKHESKPWHVFGHIWVGDYSYRYTGKIKFDGIVAESDFRLPPQVALKIGEHYYFIAYSEDNSGDDFELYAYDGHSVRLIKAQEAPMELLTYRLPADLPECKEWGLDARFYSSMLRTLFKSDQKKCHEMLRRCLDRNLFHGSKFLARSSGFTDILEDAIIFEKLAPGMKEVFFEDIQDIVKLSIHEFHSTSDPGDYIFLLLLMDRPRAVAFAEEFCREYERADKAGKLNLYYGGYGRGDPRRDQGFQTVKGIKYYITEFDADAFIKRFREEHKKRILESGW